MADTTGKECIPCGCDNQTQIHLVNMTAVGTDDFLKCEDCPLQMRPSQNGSVCIQDTCNSTFEILDLNGTCVNRTLFLSSSKPRENSFRTNLKLDGDISEM